MTAQPPRSPLSVKVESDRSDSHQANPVAVASNGNWSANVTLSVSGAKCQGAHPGISGARCSRNGRKVSDEFTVPLCRSHHRELHRSGSEYCGGKTSASTRSRPQVMEANAMESDRANATVQSGGPYTGHCPDRRGRTERRHARIGAYPRPTMTSHRQFEANRRAILTKRTQFARLRHSPLQSSNWA
jgi:hypothetical protein